MGLRVIIVEQDAEDLAMLKRVIIDLGHEFETATGPEFCQAYQLQRGYCPLVDSCCDLQLINQHALPRISGIKFIDWQRRCGCKLPGQNSAVMSVDWSDQEARMAKRYGITTLTKPFMVKELVDWIYRINNSRRSCAPS